MRRPSKPLLIFDSECSFCRAWIARWRHAIGDRIDYAPFQECASRFPEIPVERFREAVHLIEPDGRVSRGAEAVFRSLAHAPGHGAWLWLYGNLPGIGAVSEWCYRIVSRHRSGFFRLTRWIWGEHLVPPGETLTCWLFLRALGVIGLAAFLSLWVQVIGLVGHDGILPVEEYLRAIRERYGPVCYWLAPTVCWLSASDGALHALCAAGALVSLLVAFGVAPILSLVGMWGCYLSLATVCEDFLWFQWDGLLLETIFVAIFISSWRWWSLPRRETQPPRAALWLVRWLCFRLMFSSAVVKLTSGDPTWRDLTALQYHYETQPLPPWTAWYAHHLPAGFQKLSAVVLFAIEGLAPFLFLGPRRIRFAGAAALIGLQILIFVTGNYGVFNLLAIALCIPLLDDAVWPRAWRERLAAGPRAPEGARWPPALVVAAAITLFAISLVPLWGALRWPVQSLGPVTALYQIAAPLRTVNSYGLFAIMTTRRPEIIVEGSMDGVAWRPYEFRYKPGDLERRPEFMAPHMPRLDWQMWFAALGDFRREPWFLKFCESLLRGSKPVVALVAKNPFPETPPRFVRALVYDYYFTDAATRRSTGTWWRRELRGPYVPVLMLENGRLAPAPVDSAGR